MIFATTPTTNEKNGNGKYSGLRRRKKRKPAPEQKKSTEFNYLSSSKDITMRFNNSKDPIYFAFEYLEKRSVMQLFGDFVKDSVFEVTQLFS